MKTISIIIPCFNERDTLERVIAAVEAANTLGLAKEIIVIDDASTDGTADILQTMAEKIGAEKTMSGKASNIKIIFHDVNEGKGAAVLSGLREATGDIILIQDADLEYNPENYPALLAPLLPDQSGVIHADAGLRR